MIYPVHIITGENVYNTLMTYPVHIITGEHVYNTLMTYPVHIITDEHVYNTLMTYPVHIKTWSTSISCPSLKMTPFSVNSVMPGTLTTVPFWRQGRIWLLTAPTGSSVSNGGKLKWFSFLVFSLKGITEIRNNYTSSVLYYIIGLSPATVSLFIYG